MSAGTFYTYFDNREMLLRAIINEAYDESLNPEAARPADQGDPLSRIRHGNRTYVESYRRNADIQSVIVEASFVDEDVRILRFRRAQSLFRRNAATIEELQARGIVERHIAAHATARALSLMVARNCHYVYVEGHELDVYGSAAGALLLAEELSDTWIRALGLSVGTTTGS